MLVAGGTAQLRQPKVVNPVVEQEIFKDWLPDQAGVWQSLGAGDVVLPPPDTLSGRLYDNLVTRVYQGDGGEEVMLLLAYNNRQDGMLQVHRPEVCYPVGGFRLTRTQPSTLPLGSESVPSSQFTAISAGRTEHVMYFTRVGEEFPRTWAQQRTAVVQDNIRGIIPDGIMMRLSSLAPDHDRAMDSMRRFADNFYRAADPQLRKLLTKNA